MINRKNLFYHCENLGLGTRAEADRRKRSSTEGNAGTSSGGKGEKSKNSKGKEKKKSAEKTKKSSSQKSTKHERKKEPGNKKKRKSADKDDSLDKKRRKKNKKSRGKSTEEESGSETTSTSDSSSSSSESSETSSGDSTMSSSSSGVHGEKRGRERRNRKDKMVDLDLLEELWPAEDRPAKLQRKRELKGLSMSKLLKLKEQFEKESEKKGMGAAVYGRDKKPKAKRFKGQKDDGETILHPARFESMPWVEPAKYWQAIPTSRVEIFRHLPLEHLGVEGVPETTIVKLHNRKVPVELAMMLKDITEIRHVQIAVYNYVALLRSLHPADHGALVILNVLTHAGWAESIGDSDKQRIQIMRKFFDDTVRENSGRAVRREPPLDPEQGRARWLKAVAVVILHLSLMGVSQQMAAMGSGAGKQQSQKGGKNGKGGGGGNSGGGGGGGHQGGRPGQSGHKGGAPGGSGPVRTPARFNGMPVCFGFNNVSGCSRLAAGSTAKNCVDGTTSFAHVCNYFIKGSGPQGGNHCLAGHPKHGNH